MASFLGVRVPFTADGTAFKRGLNNMRKDSEGFAGSLKSMFKDAFSVAGGIGIASGISRLVDGVKSIGMQAIKSAADMESMSIAMEVMVGDAGKAAKLLKEIVKFADTTPLQTDDLVKASKTLMGFGVEVEDLMPDLKMLGDLSQGDAEKLQSLALAFGQVNAAGKLMGQEVLQFVNNGMNPLKMIADQTGVEMGVLRKRMEEGGISVADVRKAFIGATSQGGDFFQMLDRQGKTTLGLFSTLKDAWARIMRVIGTPINDWLRPWIEKAIAALSQFGDAFAQSIKNGEAIEFLKQGMAAAASIFADGLKAAVVESAKALKGLLKEIPGGKRVAEGGGAIMRLLKAAGEEGDALRANFKMQQEMRDQGYEFDLQGRITKRPPNKDGGGKPRGKVMGAVATFADNMRRLAEQKADDDFFAKAKYDSGYMRNGPMGSGSKGITGQLADAIKSAFGVSMAKTGEAYGFSGAPRPEMKQGEIPSIIASELATMGLGGRAAGFGGFDPLVEQMKSSVDYQRRMAEYLQQIASKSGAYEPVA